MTTDGMSFSLWVFLGVLAIQIFDVAAEEVGGSCASVGSEGNCVVSREDSIPNAEKPTCNLYLAESTIPGAGLGIFTGIDLDVDDWVGYEDVLLPLVDMAYHQRAWYSKNVREKKYATDPTADYAWSGPIFGVQQESSHREVSAFGPGLDSAINCNMALVNLWTNPPKSTYDLAGLHRSTDPGAGAFTPYSACTKFVDHRVPAGGELFVDYGDQWFLGRAQLASQLAPTVAGSTSLGTRIRYDKLTST